MAAIKKGVFACMLLIGVSAGHAQSDSTLVCETCTASYYARAFEGRKCSSGQVFRHDSLTAAHKNLKFGTRVKVTNLKNDSSIIVIINDRLPKYSHRCIDLTKRGAKQLNFIPQGLAKVKLEVLPDAPKPATIEAVEHVILEKKQE